MGSMIRETGRNISEEHSALFTRTRAASRTFVGETRGAGRDFLRFVRSETKRWQRYVIKATDQTRKALTFRTLERVLLVRADETLRALDSSVCARLRKLDRKPRRRVKARRARKPHANNTIAAAA